MSENAVSSAASRCDLEDLQGTWRTVAVEVDGSPVPSWQFEYVRLVVSGDRFTLRNELPDAAATIDGVFRLDVSKTPKQLTLVLDSGETVEEIYELKENELRVCYPIRGGKRPADFTTAPQSGRSLVFYERES